MSYLALYRKYRPKVFDEVIDQEHITKTLINQIKSDKIGHAYLFCGSRGTGKTSTAKIFARAINCEKPVDGSPCGKCKVCMASADNNIDILEIDAASNNGVDEIRELREVVKYPPVNGKYKVIIIDEVHMLTTSAFNALLKTLEEPPRYVVFILATTEVHKIPATILSRCMRFDFKLVRASVLSKHIMKVLDDNKLKYEEKAVDLIARAGEGSVRDALSIADMVIAYSNGNLSYQNVVNIIGSIEKEKLFDIVQCMLQKDMGKVLYELDKLLDEGKPPLVLSKDLISYFRDLLVIMTIPEKASEMVVVPTDVFDKMKLQAVKENYNLVIRAIEVLGLVEQELRYSVQPKIVLETTIIKAMTMLSLEQRVEQLEKKLQASSLEVKKKISSNVASVSTSLANAPSGEADEAGEIFGEFLKYLREKSLMMLYSAIADATNFEITNSTFKLNVRESALTKDLDDKQSKDFVDAFFARLGLKYKFNIIKDTKEQIVERLKGLIGNKLVIDD